MASFEIDNTDIEGAGSIGRENATIGVVGTLRGMPPGTVALGVQTQDDPNNQLWTNEGSRQTPVWVVREDVGGTRTLTEPDRNTPYVDVHTHLDPVTT